MFLVIKDRGKKMRVNKRNFLIIKGAEYGNRTRLPGLGSPCTTDVLIPLILTPEMEPIPGLEPGTYALRMRCSTN